MAHRFNIRTVGKVMDSFKALDGDWSKVTNPDQGVDVGINPPMQTFATTCGRPIDTTYLPTRLRPNGRRRQLPDLVTDSLTFLCSEKVRSIVETFEPGVHAFYPISFEWRTGDPDTGHFVWIVQNTIKGLHPDHLDPPYDGPDKIWAGYYAYKHPDRKIVFSEAAIGNAHIWADPQLSYTQFISDELAEAFEAAEVSGFSPSYRVEVV